MLNKFAPLVSMALFCGTALAEQPAPAPAGPPKAPAENDALKPYMKSWACDSTLQSGDGKQTKVKTTIAFKPSLNNFWWSIAYDHKKQKDFGGFHGDGTLGFDPSSKKYVLVGFDDDAGWLDLTADSIGADKVEWTGQAHGKKGTVPFKFTWVKKSDKEAAFTIQLTPPGAPTPVTAGESDCKTK
jgi:hypothetical protein